MSLKLVASNLPVFVKADAAGEEFSESMALISEGRDWLIDPPEKEGWYNASIIYNNLSFRYWDGACWSSDIPASRWHSREHWLAARNIKERPSSRSLPLRSLLLRWRNVKPYRDGEEWDFLRE